MPLQPSPTSRKTAKLFQFFRRIDPRPPLAPEATHIPSSTGPKNAVDAPSALVTPQNTFKRSNVLEKDITILYSTYIVQQTPELRRLIRLIVEIHTVVEDKELVSVLETCAMFSFRLGSALNVHPTETIRAISDFTKAVERIYALQYEDKLQLNNESRHIVDGAIAKITSSYPSIRRIHKEVPQNHLKKLDALIGQGTTVLEIARLAAEAVPVPLVKSAVGAMLGLMKAIDQTRTNFNIMNQLTTTAGEFVVSLAVHCSAFHGEPSPRFERALFKFIRTLEDIAEQCNALSELNPFQRFLQQGVHTVWLEELKLTLDKAITLFQTESQVRLELDIVDIGRKIDWVSLNNLSRHPIYESNDYLPGSREDVIREIANMIGESNDLVFWVHGAAGLGKSTMAQQLVAGLKSDDCLAGGVFLTRIPTEHPNQVIQMIARQLGEMHPQAIPDIIDAVRKFDSPHHSLRDSLALYIINPVKRLKYPYQLVIVIDGLDEWMNCEAFLQELEHIPSPSPIKFILTSRPNHSIERLLFKIGARSYPLPPVPKTVIENYFNLHFENIDWRGRKPDPLMIGRLADRAEGLLVWAATVRSVLSYEFDARDPHLIIEEILSAEQNIGAQADQQLERLYRAAISNLFPKPDERAIFFRFFGAMMVLQESLSLRDFSRIVGVAHRPAEEVQRRLMALQTHGTACLGTVLPASQQFHVSLLEFMRSLHSADDDGLNIHTVADGHRTVAGGCVHIVFSELVSPRIGGTQSLTSCNLDPAELYAIKFWPLHVSNAIPRLPATLSATELGKAVSTISEEGMVQWALLFLVCIGAKFDGGDHFVGNIGKHAVLFQLAMMMGKDDPATFLYWLHCLELCVRLEPDHVDAWIALGEGYERLYEEGRHNHHLDEEIVVLDRALKLVLDKSRGQVVSPSDEIMTQLALALRARFLRKSCDNDLREAISWNRMALVHRSVPHPNRWQPLTNLALALWSQSRRQGNRKDLDEAILLNREALALCPAPHSSRALSLNRLADTLWTRFERQGIQDDLDEAILLNQEALELCPAPHPDRSQTLNSHALALHSRFLKQGTRNDLDETIVLHREALALRPLPHPNRAPSLNKLALALFDRFCEQGVIGDLDEGILLNREALGRRPVLHSNRPQSLNNLGLMLHVRHSKWGGGDDDDLEEAIVLHREALALRMGPHPDRWQSLVNLSVALEARFQRRNTRWDFDEAGLLRRQAVILLSACDPQLADVRRVLGIGLDAAGGGGCVLDELQIRKILPYLLTRIP